MSWIDELTKLVKNLLDLKKNIDNNTTRLETLRKDLDALNDFTRKVAQVVRENRSQITRNQEKNESDREILVLRLENALLSLENRLMNNAPRGQPPDPPEPPSLPDT
ncbi:MAG: hypothetical protein AAGG51_22140 [Cyanobacteria bacterium P01_G01_bin.54]